MLPRLLKPFSQVGSRLERSGIGAHVAPFILATAYHAPDGSPPWLEISTGFNLGSTWEIYFAFPQATWHKNREHLSGATDVKRTFKL